jgi:hypothetical protein
MEGTEKQLTEELLEVNVSAANKRCATTRVKRRGDRDVGMDYLA